MSRTDNQPSENKDIAKYRCQICGFTASHEGIVRAHMSLSSDEEHELEYVFMPETKVDGLSHAGDIIMEIGGKTQLQYRLSDIDVSNLPSVHTNQDTRIVKTALENFRASFAEITEKVNESTQHYPDAQVEYSTVYETVVEALGIQRRSHETTSPDDMEFEDLTKKQQAVIESYAVNPEQSEYEIAQVAGVSPTYPGAVLDKYEHIAESRREQLMSQEVAYPRDREYSKFSDRQFEVLNEIARNPKATADDIADSVGCDVMFPRRMREHYPDQIRQRRVDLGLTDGSDRPSSTQETEAANLSEADDVGVSVESTVTDVSEHEELDTMSEKSDTETELIETKYAQYEVTKGVAEKYNELTGKQKVIIDELIVEPDPASPSRTNKQIAEAAGATQGYTSQVKSKHLDLAQDVHDGTKMEQIQETPFNTSQFESFSERFAAAVENEKLSEIKVPELKSNIQEVENVSNIEAALDQETRKTARAVFEGRLERLRSDIETSQETIDTLSETAEEDNIIGESVEQDDTEEPAQVSDSDTQIESEVVELYQRAQMMHTVTQYEIDNGITDPSVVTKNAVVEVFKKELGEILDI